MWGMELSPEAIQEFKEIHKKETGEKLSDQEALDLASNLLTLFDTICQPIPKHLIEQQKDQFQELYALLDKKGKLV